jgi:3'-phosphoadenosine 5'-phosphosulfate sulfotransferase (PAPS reductase)/FAD synthetase
MKTITILSLGAGVQSTALALMAERGMIEKPIAAIFSDTGDEPATVYAHLENLKSMLSFPVHTVKFGNGLGNDFLAALRGETNRASQPPFYVKQADLSQSEIEAILEESEPNRSEFVFRTKHRENMRSDEFDFDADSDDFNDAWNAWNIRRRKALNQDQGGMIWRQCTKDYKITPIRRKTRELMLEHGAKHVISQIGISTDERQRERASGVKFITNSHPLLELGWSRRDCESWLLKEFGMKAAKSACVYCPYRSNAGWKLMKRDEPEAFEAACQYDEAIRESQGKRTCGAGITGQLFVWRGFAPLRTAEFETNPDQMDFGFEQECDGMCGH